MMNKFLDKWSSAITGLMIGSAMYIVGSLAILIYKAYWISGITVYIALSGGNDKSLSMIEQQLVTANEFWLLLALGSILIGVAVWIMEVIAKNLGPPFS